MRASECLSEQQIMRCVVDSGPMSGQHLAMLERQKWAQATAERHAALKANPPEWTALVEPTTPNGIGTRLSHWMGSRLISAGHHLEGSAT